MTVGLSHGRLFVLVPSPHVVEQSDHGHQFPQPPSPKPKHLSHKSLLYMLPNNIKLLIKQIFYGRLIMVIIITLVWLKIGYT